MIRPSVGYWYRFNECKAKLSAVAKLETNDLIDKLVDYLRKNYLRDTKTSNVYVLEAVIYLNLIKYQFKVLYDYNDFKIRLDYFELV